MGHPPDVYPPVNGVITYELDDGPNGGNGLQTLVAVALAATFAAMAAFSLQVGLAGARTVAAGA